jgi:hypothetical protein
MVPQSWRRRPHDLDRFTETYAEVALDDSADDDGAALSKYGVERLAPETVRLMRADCANFRREAGDTADQFDVVDVAFDFWKERNGSKYAGFWDGDYPQPAATELTRIARGFGRFELYLDDDDGLIRSR